MDKDIILILDECLDRVLLHGETIEQCLEQFPAHREELEPLLRLALDARSAAQISLDPTKRAAGKGRLLQALQGKQQEKAMAGAGGGWSWLLVGSRRWAVTAAGVFLMLMTAAGGTAAASLNSMPDSPLYPMKRFTEDVQLTFTFGSVDEAKLRAKFADRRALEIQRLAERGKFDDIPGIQVALAKELSAVERLNLEVLQRSLQRHNVPAAPRVVLAEFQAGAVSITIVSPTSAPAAATADPSAGRTEGEKGMAPVPGVPPAPGLVPRPTAPGSAQDAARPGSGTGILLEHQEDARKALREHQRRVKEVRRHLVRLQERIEDLEEKLVEKSDRQPPGLVRQLELLRQQYNMAVLSAGGVPSFPALEGEDGEDDEDEVEDEEDRRRDEQERREERSPYIPPPFRPRPAP
jgi:hypothetical protein